MSTLDGQCICGGVTVRLPAPTYDVGACHCARCRRWGSGPWLSFQVPNKFRRELRGTSPSLTVSNGQKLWIYYPKFNEAELYSLGQRAFFDDAIAALTAGLNFQQVAQYYRYTAFKEGGGYRLVLLPRTSGLKRMLKELTIWVDDEYKIDRTVAVLVKDDRVTTTYRNQKPTPIPASTFDYTPPVDARVTEPLGK